jgi:hypothetical protein
MTLDYRLVFWPMAHCYLLESTYRCIIVPTDSVCNSTLIMEADIPSSNRSYVDVLCKRRIRIFAALKIPNFGHKLFYLVTVIKTVTHRAHFETLRAVRYKTMEQLTTGYRLRVQNWVSIVPRGWIQTVATMKLHKPQWSSWCGEKVEKPIVFQVFQNYFYSLYSGTKQSVYS